MDSSVLNNMVCCASSTKMSSLIKTTDKMSSLKTGMPSLGTSNPFNAASKATRSGPVDFSKIKSPIEKTPSKVDMVSNLLSTPVPSKAGASDFTKKLLSEINKMNNPKTSSSKSIFTYGSLMGLPSKTSGAAQALSYSSIGPGAADLGFISSRGREFMASPIPAGRGLKSFNSINNLHQNLATTNMPSMPSSRAKMNFSNSTIQQGLGNSNRLI